MNIPDYLHAHVAEQISIGTDAEIRRGQWAVIYGLVPYKDGDSWCVLLGKNLQEGVAGFGDTPQAAICDFERNFTTPPNPEKAPSAPSAE